MNWEEWTHIAEIVKDLRASIESITKELGWVTKVVDTLESTLDASVKEAED